MFITCEQKELLEEIQVVQKAASIRSTLPILSGILFSASAGRLHLTTTNLELSIHSSLPAEVKEEGSLVVQARLIGEIIKNLSDLKIEMFLDSSTNQLKLTNSKSVFNIKILSPEDFPKFPTAELDNQFTIKSEDLSNAIRQAIKAASIDETRPILTGVLIVVNKNRLKMVATDSYRLAIKEIPIINKEDVKIKAIIPSRTLGELLKIVSDGRSEVVVGEMGNQLAFKIKNTTLITRLIEGQYPNYQQILPEKYEMNFVVDRENLLGAVKRISLFTQSNSLIKMAARDGSLELSASAAELGEAKEAVDYRGTGDGLTVAFNSQYLIDGLSSIQGEEVSFDMIDNMKPTSITGDKKDDFLHLLMPVRTG
ncbi:MAG: DNA polymerase III subunit beta [Actinomycetota bacterium]|nr:DNA polymerase III subunit beta [Actinomycetota bacterium]